MVCVMAAFTYFSIIDRSPVLTNFYIIAKSYEKIWVQTDMVQLIMSFSSLYITHILSTYYRYCKPQTSNKRQTKC